VKTGIEIETRAQRQQQISAGAVRQPAAVRGETENAVRGRATRRLRRLDGPADTGHDRYAVRLAVEELSGVATSDRRVYDGANVVTAGKAHQAVRGFAIR
jgi:hypothetical protein